jgi:hypothetical protein
VHGPPSVSATDPGQVALHESGADNRLSVLVVAGAVEAGDPAARRVE